MNEDLLIRHIAGITTAQEEHDIELWRQQSPQHEALLRRLTDAQAMQTTYRQQRDIAYQPALRQMQQRLRQRRQLRLWRGVAAVAILLLVASLSMQLFRSHDVPAVAAIDSMPLQPGSTRATLILASGQTMPLASDASGLPVVDLAERARTDIAHMPQRDSHHEATSSEKSRSEIFVPRGGEFKVVLEDGTTVWLNADSHLYYPDSFEADERRVAVEGEAYFQVARDEQRPFLVETSGQLVRVLGTEFNIHSFPDETQVLTTLVRGSIAMSPLDRPDSQLRLTPGHQASFSKRQRDIRVTAVDAEAVASWKDGVIVCTGQTLDQIMHTLSRWYDFDYTIADAHVAKAEFVGQVTRYDNFDDVCQILEKCGGIRIVRNGRHVRVEK